MCGIAGILALAGTPPTREELTRMAASLHHRGPDEFGVYRDRGCGLAHARLSIIDLSTGQQPLANEDNTLWISFNGEIFNYVELREELVALGHIFRTKSDTEVIVHAYEAWGDDAFARFNGQFAIALWDEKTERLVLARDRLGVRPLPPSRAPSTRSVSTKRSPSGRSFRPSRSSAAWTSSAPATSARSPAAR
jgi:asparagine synthase (glutamine-hydrolysing)